MNIYVPNLRLPSEYQEVEYIETTGTQFINTGLYAGNNIQVETKIAVNSTSQPQIVFACYRASGSDDLPNNYGLAGYQNAWYYGLNGSEGNGGTYSPTIGTEYVIVYNNANNYININGSDVLNCAGTTGYAGTTLGIAVRANRNLSGSFKYYYFRMYNKTTGTYERDFVPCYRKSDNVIGLYDLVNSVFYTNAGTGTFTKGNDVTSLELKNDYIGEYKGFEYNYDFRNKSASQLSTDGRSVVSGRLETSAYGITAPVNYDVTVGKSGLDLSNANKITITFTSVWNRDDSGKRYIQFGLINANYTSQNLTILVLSSGYSTSKVEVYTNGTRTDGTDIGNIGQSTYTSTFEIDLVNKTLTGTIPGLGVSTLSLTDAQVKTIRGLTNLTMYTTQHTFYLQDISITIE